MTQHSYKDPQSYKTAGAVYAMNELGLEKNAIIGTLLGKAVGALGSGIGRLGMGVGKGLWRTGTGASRTLGKGIGNFGTEILSSAQKAGLSPGAAKTMGTLGKGMGGDIAGFGLFSGGLEAAMADPGDRLNAFGRGALAGGLGGAAWGAGRNIARMGIGKGLSAAGSSVGQMKALAKPGFFGAVPQGGSRLQSVGAKALMSGVPTAAALGASFLAPGSIGAGAQQQQQPFYAQQRTYYPAMGAMRNMRGLTPNSY